MDKNVYLITGSPGAGKSTFAKDHAGDSDIIIDLDEINKALGGKMHEDNKAQLGVAMAMRDAAIREISARSGSWDNAYFITATSDRSEIDQLINTLGAEEVPIDTPLEECHRRAQNDETRADKAKADKLIDEWHKRENKAPEDAREAFAEWAHKMLGGYE